MDFSEPANWARIRSDAEEFVARYVTREVIENERRSGDGADRELTRKLGECGWIAPAWPAGEAGLGRASINSRPLCCWMRCAGEAYRRSGTGRRCCRPTRSGPPVHLS